MAGRPVPQGRNNPAAIHRCSTIAGTRRATRRESRGSNSVRRGSSRASACTHLPCVSFERITTLLYITARTHSGHEAGTRCPAFAVEVKRFHACGQIPETAAMAIASIRIGSMVLLVASVGGCAISNATVPLGAEQEKVKQVFVSFQKVLKDADAEKIWAILEADSQADAERKAETIRDIMATGSDAEKAEMERKLGLPGADLAAVKGE